MNQTPPKRAPNTDRYRDEGMGSMEKTNSKRSRGTHATHVTTAQERRVRENDKTRKQKREIIRDQTTKPNHTNQTMKPNHAMRERKSEQTTPRENKPFHVGPNQTATHNKRILDVNSGCIQLSEVQGRTRALDCICPATHVLRSAARALVVTQLLTTRSCVWLRILLLATLSNRWSLFDLVPAVLSTWPRVLCL